MFTPRATLGPVVAAIAALRILEPIEDTPTSEPNPSHSSFDDRFAWNRAQFVEGFSDRAPGSRADATSSWMGSAIPRSRIGEPTDLARMALRSCMVERR